MWITNDGRVGCTVYHGNAAVLEVEERVRELAGEFTVREVVYDPWRFQAGSLRLAEHGLVCVSGFPQQPRPSGGARAAR